MGTIFYSKRNGVNYMDKELHIWLIAKFPIETLHDYTSVNNAILGGMEVLHTTNTHFCNTKYIVDLNYRIFAHMKNECVEIKLGSNNKNTSREIKIGHNLEKLLLSNEFGLII